MQARFDPGETTERWSTTDPDVLTMMRRIAERHPDSWECAQPTPEHYQAHQAWVAQTYGATIAASHHTFVDPRWLPEV